MRTEDAIDAEYWVRHACEPVRFSEQIQELLKDSRNVLLETGAPVLSSMVLQNAAGCNGTQPCVANLLRHSSELDPDLAYALRTLGRLWSFGVQPDWPSFYARERRKRVLLPTYPFERQRYWMATQDDVQTRDRRAAESVQRGDTWFYTPSWRRVPRAKAPAKCSGVVWIVGGAPELSSDLLQALESAGNRAFRVDASDYKAAIDQMGAPAAIACLWATEPTDGNPREDAAALVEALADEGIAEPVRFCIVSDRLYEVTGGEDIQFAAAQWVGAFLAAVRGRRQFVVSNSDINLAEARGSRWRSWIPQLAAEITSGGSDQLVAWRGGHRWISALAAPGEQPQPTSTSTDGCVLICGLGDVGLSLAEQLANMQTPLVLLDDSGLPTREVWNDWLTGDTREGTISATLQRILAIEERTGTMVASIDLREAHHLGGILESARQRFTAVKGIICISSDEATSTADRQTPEATIWSALDEATRGWRLQFRLLLSFTPAVSTAQRHLSEALAADAFALNSARHSREPWTSITIHASSGVQHRCPDLGSVVAFVGPQLLIVSDRPLPENWNKVNALLQKESGASEGEALQNYPRPNLRVNYVAPRNHTEEILVGLWRDLLGIDQIGIYDNFLDLGGDSLVAVRLASRLRDTLHEDLPMRVIFEASTVAELAAAIDRLHTEEDPESAELMALIDQLSEEEIEQELRKRQLAEETAV